MKIIDKELIIGLLLLALMTACGIIPMFFAFYIDFLFMLLYIITIPIAFLAFLFLQDL